MSNVPIRIVSFAFALGLAGCATSPQRESPVTASAVAPAAGRDDVNAVIWMQTATEVEALSRQAFRVAESEVQNAVQNLKFLQSLGTGAELGPLQDAFEQAERQQRSFNALVEAERAGPDAADEPLAVIVDVDETIIDNSPFQARNIRAGRGFDRAYWNAWSQERRARALPGAVDFAKFLNANGVTLFYITNRDVTLREATAANLEALGFPLAAGGANLLPRDDSVGWTGEKGTRRSHVDRTHRVVLMMGDNLGDFVDGVYTDVDARRELVEPYAAWWGQRWLMLPNPAYGSWESAVNEHCKDGVKNDDQRACKLSHLRAE